MKPAVTDIVLLIAGSPWMCLLMVEAFPSSPQRRWRHFIAKQTSIESGRAEQICLQASPTQFIQLVPRTARGSKRVFDVQTAVVRFKRTLDNGNTKVVDLHSQLHFASSDFFQYYNSIGFQRNYDRILYELLVTDDLLARDLSGQRVLKSSSDGANPIMASSTDRQTAYQYGLECQVDAVDYTLPNWIHADLSREELLRLVESEKGGASSQADRPLWALASTAPSWPGSEAFSALFQPSTPSISGSTPVARRLFSNLFLPGNALTGLFRSLFWLAVPAPELSVMLLDWSSIIPRPTGGVSKVAIPVLECLVSGNLREARQLVFGQMLVNGQSSSSNEEFLVQKRNDQALSILDKTRQQGSKRAAILYGAMHCDDLKQKLMRDGFQPIKTTWRTAWSVQVPSLGTGEASRAGLDALPSISPAAAAVGLVVLPVYLAIGALDWISQLDAVVEAIQHGSELEAITDVLLYLVRHVIIYLSLAKFVVEWDGTTTLFSDDR